MLRTKLTAGAMSAVLAVTLCPGLAMAAPLGTGSIADDGDNAATLTTQKDKKVWVIANQGYTYTNHGLVKTAPNGWVFNYSGTKLKNARNGAIHYRLFYSNKKLNKGWMKVAGGAKTKYSFKYDGKNRICQQVATITTKDWLGRKLQKARTLSTTTIDIARNDKGYPIQMRSYTESATGASSKSLMLEFSFDRGDLVKAKGNNLKSSFFSNRYKKVGKDQRISRTTVERWNWVNHDWTVDEDHFEVIKYSYMKLKVPEKFVSTVKAQQWALQNCNLNKAFGPIDSVAEYEPLWYYDTEMNI